MKKVLVTEEIHARGQALLAARGDVEILRVPDIEPATLAAAVPGVHGILARSAVFPAAILARADELTVVSRHGVGCDNIDVAHLSARGIPVAIAAGANSRSVAEHTLGLMLAATRRLPLQDRVVKNGGWATRNDYRAGDMIGARALIVGFGRIGRLVAQLCKAFEMDVAVADIALDAELAARMGCRGLADFRSELPTADFVSLHVPLNETTRRLIGAPELAAMKPDAILVNCARGGVVDEDALLAALETGALRGAALDVMIDEPPDAAHPLIGRDDVVMTPHNGAAGVSAMIAMAEMSAQNVLDAFDGKLRRDRIFNAEALRAVDPARRSDATGKPA